MTRKPTEIIGSLLTIGDEILFGDIPNGNARYIALQLRSRGFRLGKMLTVGDCEEEIMDALSRCLENSRFLIVTGGLGPTEDDRTSQAVARAFQKFLAPHGEYMGRLRMHLAEHGRPWSEYVERMALIPEGAEKLGMDSAGFFLEHQGTPCYFLPGVPHEMRTLMGQRVIPDLDARFPHRPVYLKHLLRVVGLFESQISESLKGLTFEGEGVQVGYLPHGAEVWITLFAVAETESDARRRVGKAEDSVISRVGAHNVCGRDEESLEWVIGRRLRERSWRLAVAESCTGGLLSCNITTVSGSSDYFDRGYVTYSNEAKTALLGVSEEMLKAHGAVSEPVARAMAEGARKEGGVDVALSITGIAGPAGGSPEKPVGTVFVACATVRETACEKHLFPGDREQIRESAAQAALVLLWRMLPR
jgi:nicotinamide-nucleotide amidase